LETIDLDSIVQLSNDAIVSECLKHDKLTADEDEELYQLHRAFWASEVQGSPYQSRSYYDFRDRTMEFVGIANVSSYLILVKLYESLRLQEEANR